MATVLDVLENALDGELTADRAASLSDQDLSQLAEVLADFYATWRPPPPAAGELRAYPGGWVAANYGGAEARSLLASTLLYFDTVVVHDPIGEWFDPRRGQLRGPPPIRYRNGVQVQSAQVNIMAGDGYYAPSSGPARAREHLKWMLPMLMDLAPLIRSGVAIPINQIGTLIDRQEAILAGVRHDLRDSQLVAEISNPIDLQPVTADYSRGLQLQMEGAGGVVSGDEIRAIAQNPAYFLTKTIALADAVGARYTPPAATDHALYVRRLQRAGEELSRSAGLDLRIAAALTRTPLPFVGALELPTLVQIRENEGSFEEWRSQVRSVVRQIEATPDSEDFADNAREVFDDGFAVVAAEVRRATQRSTVLQASIGDATINLVTGLAVAGGAVLAGADGLNAAAFASASAASSWALRALFLPRQTGARAVIAALMRK